ncbi:peptidase M10 [Halopiger xanaduensis]|uniref:Peptidase M10A and M12B matrixin and adamalysin n=1 Tax=Halopiger xanaduensis (strain DSM 18323 / JCM 14033 / SH-6) TaxID=797210 RepID=F8D5Y4_HALXS|nr:peptidase M10 [Halopiger xanaduensis]AEH37711.1 peptidase M10A and M12B matrixin and adamalysin [Halopiger xanaduensis SH-6]
MNRRAFLGAVGSVASLGTLAYATRAGGETLEVRVWFSDRAADYDDVPTRIREYLGRILELGFWTVDLSIGGTVPVSTEDGAQVTRRGEWPLAVAAGAIGARDLRPAADVNLLVTDGAMTRAPTGYGLPRVASVGGARHIDDLEPFDDLFGGDGGDSEPSAEPDPRRIAPLTDATRTMQVLVHEVGHALGLRHEHGVAFRDGDAVVATPMISAYAFGPDRETDRSRCGIDYPDPTGRERALSFAFSSCARRELATVAGRSRIANTWRQS